MKRKLLLLLLAVGALLAISVPALAGVTDTGFSDVSPDAWYAEGVSYCQERGLMSGTGATTFAPDEPMTRAMLMTVLYRLAGEPAVSAAAPPFRDVEPGTWYTNATLWAQQNHIASGYGDGRFGTNDPIRREQLAAILWRYAGSPETGTAENFSDRAEVSAYAVNAVDWASTAGVIAGRTENSFVPASPATRGEVAMAFMNFARLKEMEQKPDTMPNILIAYFSWAGHTEQIAKEIQSQTGGDLFVIQPATPYTKDINELSGIALQEQRDNVRPALGSHVEDMEQYDIVFVGYPCWWSNAPMPVFTFLEEYSFAGKTIIPFTSYGENVWGRSLDSIADSANSAAIAEGFAIQEHQMENLSEQITEWLQGLDLLK